MIIINVQFINQLLSILTILGQVATAAIFLHIIYYKFINKKNIFINSNLHFFSKNALFFSFLVSLGAVIGSLYYSDIIGYPPCDLCWYQRIFMYPLPFLFALALIRKERTIFPYALLLSIIGGLIALNHLYLQQSGNSLLPCSAAGVACSKIFVLAFGYITIPMMSLSVFLLIISFLLAASVRQKKT